MTESVIRDKSKMIAIRIVRLYHHLSDEKKEWVLSKQLLRSGTSIGANIVEAQAAMSKKIFLLKCTFLLRSVAKRSIGLNCFTKPVIFPILNLSQSTKTILL